MNSQYFAVAASFMCRKSIILENALRYRATSKMCFIYFNGYLTPVVDFHVDLFKRAFRYVYSSISFPKFCAKDLLNRFLGVC